MKFLFVFCKAFLNRISLPCFPSCSLLEYRRDSQTMYHNVYPEAFVGCQVEVSPSNQQSQRERSASSSTSIAMNPIIPFWWTPKHQRLWSGLLRCLSHYFVEGGQLIRRMRELVADPPLDPIAERKCILGHSIYTWRMVWRIEATARNCYKFNSAFGYSCIL